MTTTRKLADIFRAIATRDFDTAASAASDLCKAEEKIGHRTAARTLRSALRASNGSSQLPLDALPAGQSVFSTALVRLTSNQLIENVVLQAQLKAELNLVVSEWRQAARLKEHGLSPRSKLLFYGPPGCGKSMTAVAIGNELDLPVYMVRFDAVIGAFLGQTAIHLRQLFHFAETVPCVLLLDELDALGKRRGNPLDVGELDRIVISLLQELEHSKPLGIVVATTNLHKHLDDALWRRFELDLEFRLPSAYTLQTFIAQVATRYGIQMSPSERKRALAAKSFAGAERVVIAAARRKALKRGVKQ